MKKSIKIGFRALAIFAIVFILYILGSITYATLYDYQPDEVNPIEVKSLSKKLIIDKDTLSAISWNIGYTGLGDDSYMFYEQGSFYFSHDYDVNPPLKKVKRSLEGVKTFSNSHDADFFLFQEVDINSKRSHFINQYETIQNELEQYSSSFAMNYNVSRVPFPIFEPWDVGGKVQSGLATYSRYDLKTATRHQLPGNYAWPTRIFHLDRCLSKHSIPTKNGKDLILINLHNSAYDENGFIKKQQLEYLSALVLEEYNIGNYVVVGGDWNQTPPGADIDKIYTSGVPGQDKVKESPNFMPSNWTWAFDDSSTTSRRVDKTYEKGVNDEKLIDFYLVSPNVEIVNIEILKADFKFSDHEAVRCDFVLK